jgi:hypothetical protein
VSFIGDTENAAPSSVRAILHEVGHAQERKVSADAESTYIEAQVARNRAADLANKHAQAALDTMTVANDAWRRMSHAKRAASKGYVDAFGAAFRAIDALRADPDLTKAAALQAAAGAAVQARNTARDALPTTSPVLTAFATALTEQDAYLGAAEALLASRQAVGTTKANKGAARDPTGKRSARLQRFVDFVNEKGIKPFTQYAKDNWPGHPEEFYAEAFSFWHADPKFLDSSAPELKKWFAGEHLK